MTAIKRLNILMADDSSEHAWSAVELIRDFALPTRTKVMVLRVFTPGQITAIPDFERSLEKTKQHLLYAGVKVETELILGSPAEKIIEVAKHKKSNLIVMGAKGLRATLGILLGGVAQQVVEYARTPVLIVRAPYMGLRRILLVIDGSASSQYAARYLGKFPLPEKVDVRVMHVIPPPQPLLTMEPHLGGWQTVYLPPPEDDSEAQKTQEQKGDALLKRTCDLLQRHEISVTPILKQGDAATEIIDYVKANEIDLIVAGSLGLSQLRSWWVGSVSRKLIHYSNCSVLMVRGPQKE
ncbi:Universal stress protein/MSMEI_3859 [Anaerolineales bacterium]|nr:Universal stress protein/MSMEI_3859 [Anaerolineales bacterium]